MDKTEWTKNSIFLLLGIIAGNLLSPNAQLQAFLYQFIPPEWRVPMGILIIVAVFVWLNIWYWQLEKKSAKGSQEAQAKLIKRIVKDTITELGLTQKEEIRQDRNERNKTNNSKGI
jgi:type VI protein secretion system component VasK